MKLFTIFFIILQPVFSYFWSYSKAQLTEALPFKNESSIASETNRSNLNKLRTSEFQQNARLPVETQTKEQHLKLEPEIIVPYRISYDQEPEITAQSALVFDRKSKVVLFEKNSKEKRPMASLVKIMTALLALESKKDLEEKIIISKETAKVEPAKLHLKWGEKIRAVDLLYGALVNSANDAAYALAEYVTSNMDDFVFKMNQKAKDLGLKDTYFVNPTGLDPKLNSNNKEKGNYSTAYDLALLYDYAFDEKVIQDTFKIKEYTIFSENTGHSYHFKNTNKLLEDKDLKIIGGKTGFTDQAGWCLVEIAENNQGHQIIVVILGSQGDELRFQEAKKLIQWTFENYKWE